MHWEACSEMRIIGTRDYMQYDHKEIHNLAKSADRIEGAIRNFSLLLVADHAILRWVFARLCCNNDLEDD